MCGIVGIYNFGNNKQIEESVLRRMCNVIKHRGPDDEGYYLGEKVALGVRRLAIIDLETGHQPIHNEDKTIWIVFNGEIYNFQEIRKECEARGHRFYTNTDTETIVHLYEDYDVKCLKFLRGMFAFAIWDNHKRQLFIARDRLGKKPLVYTIQNGSLFFASEIKSLLEVPWIKTTINLDAIHLFLTYQYIPSPITIFQEIKRLQPASFMIFNERTDGCGIKISKYWQLDFTKKTNLNFEDAKERIRELLLEATKLRLVSDVPLGAFLSGGHDSSIIVGLMAKNSNKPVKTFSVGFKEQDFSELKYAKIVAKYFNTDHTEIIVEPKMVDILPKLVWHYDQPFADTSMIPSYYVAYATRKYVKVALNGDGGDENFCGYLRYPAIKLASLFPFEILGEKTYPKIIKFIPFLNKTDEHDTLRYFRRFFLALGAPTPIRNVIWHCFFTNELKNFIYSDYMKERIKFNAYNYLVDTYNSAKADHIIDKISFTDISTYLPECLMVKMDIASMANSLETRAPFLDHKLLEFTASIPSNWKLHYGIMTKYILKQVFKNFLPKEILGRKKKGFGIPIDKWLRNDLKDYVRELMYSGKAIRRPYFNFGNLKTLIEEHFSGKENHGYRIFALMVLELWHRIFIDKEIKF